MSIYQFSSDLPDTHWLTQRKQQPTPPNPLSLISHLYHHTPSATAAASTRRQNSPLKFNLNQEDDKQLLDGDHHAKETEKLSKLQDYQNYMESEEEITQKETMFEKPLTPSDVGKLNRLVIPKQHAEKYFPLGTANDGGGDSFEKGLLLSFEDESGKSWSFRYSYWNSSQSYVLTKGWSRFVKEKRLDAGDIVVFERYREGGDRFFIGWRRRNAVSPVSDTTMLAQPVVASGGEWTRVFYSGHPYPSQSHPNGPSLPYQIHCLHEGGSAGVQNQLTSSGNFKTLRLFGVNMECQSDEPIPDGSSQGAAHCYQNYADRAHVSNYQNHMDIDFSTGVDQMRYHQG